MINMEHTVNTLEITLIMASGYVLCMLVMLLSAYITKEKDK